MIRVLAAAVFALSAMSSSSTWDFIDKRKVQSATIYELNVNAPSCHSVLDAAGGLCAGVGRHFDLKPSEVDRVLDLVNEKLHYDPRARPTCAVPRQAVVFMTTEGKRAIDISLECNNVGGRAPTKATRASLAQFLRSSGFVAHVPVIVE